MNCIEIMRFLLPKCLIIKFKQFVFWYVTFISVIPVHLCTIPITIDCGGWILNFEFQMVIIIVELNRIEFINEMSRYRVRFGLMGSLTWRTTWFNVYPFWCLVSAACVSVISVNGSQILVEEVRFRDSRIL